MQEWEKLLGIQWPTNACDRSGECCRGAAQLAPWKTLFRNAAQGDLTSRAFLNQFIPYPSLMEAKQHAPAAVEASLKVARERQEPEDEVVFYRCRYLQGQSDCLIYEDRPALCRDFPESPFGAIPSCCGFAPVARQCLDAIDALKQELAALKVQQALLLPDSDVL